MRRLVSLALALTFGIAPPRHASAQQTEVLADIRVHGNTLIADDELKRLTGAQIGAPFLPTTLDEVRARLEKTNRFKSVEVLKRYASIADPSQILLVVIVDEGPVAIQMTGNGEAPTRFVKKRAPHILIFPILDVEDGYGLRYGVRLGLADKLGPQSRISFPLTWGGERKAGTEAEKHFERGPLTRVVGGAEIARRENPRFELDDTRRRIWLRAEAHPMRVVRAGATAGRELVRFGDGDDAFTHVGIDAALDTRLDATLPRNAVDIRARVERLWFRQSSASTRYEVDARGYLGLLGQSVLAGRALGSTSNRSLPLYERPLLGGMAHLRGFDAGTAAGDTLVAGSLEVIIPLTSPLSVGRLGVSSFWDSGTVYAIGERLADQDLQHGVGGTVWFSAAMVRLSLAVAHGIGARTHVHFGGSVLF